MEKTLRIYYDNIFVSGDVHEVYSNCQYVDIPESQADDYIEEKMDWGEWTSWIIPEQIHDKKIIFHI